MIRTVARFRTDHRFPNWTPSSVSIWWTSTLYTSNVRWTIHAADRLLSSQFII